MQNYCSSYSSFIYLFSRFYDGKPYKHYGVHIILWVVCCLKYIFCFLVLSTGPSHFTCWSWLLNGALTFGYWKDCMMAWIPATQISSELPNFSPHISLFNKTNILQTTANLVWWVCFSRLHSLFFGKGFTQLLYLKRAWFCPLILCEGTACEVALTRIKWSWFLPHFTPVMWPLLPTASSWGLSRQWGCWPDQSKVL